MISIDKSFIDGAYAEIYRELQKIGYYGFYFKGIRSKKEYHGSWYDLCKLSKDILGPKVRIVRNKGLGEMDEADLYETVINPRTRRTTRVTMDDAAKAKFAIDTFMGVENPDFKQKFYAGIEKFE
jgi:DNA gyrase/topoisomerase IV subunit B